MLENFKVPRKLARLQTRRKLGSIFRDETHLAGAPDLNDAIKREIAASDALIVVCSPQAARSKWVDREIIHFRETQRGHKIFPIIVSGAPNSEFPEFDCFPPSFKHGETNFEPLASDIQKDGWERAVVRLIAGLTELPFNELWERERKRQRLRTFVGSALTIFGIILTAVAVAASWFALKSDALARAQSSTVLALQSQQLLLEGDEVNALKMSLQSDPAADRYLSSRLMTGSEGHTFAENQITRLLNTHRLDWEFDTGLGAFSSLSISPDKTIIAGTNIMNGLTVWDRQSRQAVFEFDIQRDHPESIDFSHDGRFLAAGFMSGKLIVWSTEDWSEVTNTTAHKGIIGALSFTPSDEFLVSGAEDERIKIWSTQTWRRIKTLSAHTAQINDLAFSADGSLMASVAGFLMDTDSSVRIWDAEKFTPIRTINHSGQTSEAVAFSSDGNQIIFNNFNFLEFWDIDRNRLELRQEIHSDWITKLKTSLTPFILVSGSWDGSLKISDGWGTTSRFTLATIKDWVVSIDVSDDTQIIASGDRSGTLRVWNRILDEYDLMVRYKEHGLTLLKSTASGETIAVGGKGTQSILLVDKDNSRNEWHLNGEKQLMQDFALSPKRDKLVAVSRILGTGQGKLTFWRLQDAQSAPIEVNLDFIPQFVELVSDDNLLIGGYADYLVIFNISENKFVQRISTDNRTQFAGASTSDRTKFATLRCDALTKSDCELSVWRSSDYSLEWSLSLESTTASIRYQDVTFSPDGKFIALTIGNNEAVVLDAISGNNISRFTSPTQHLTSLEFSPDNRFLAVCGEDYSAPVLRDPLSGQVLKEFRQSGNNCLDMKFSADGKSLLNTSWNEIHKRDIPNILYLSAAEKEEMACELLKNAGIEPSFSQDDISIYPILRGQPVDKQTSRLVSDCNSKL